MATEENEEKTAGGHTSREFSEKSNISRGWLQHDPKAGVMSCSLCRQYAKNKNRNNLFVVGNKTMKLENIREILTEQVPHCLHISVQGSVGASPLLTHCDSTNCHVEVDEQKRESPVQDHTCHQQEGEAILRLRVDVRVSEILSL